MKLSRDKKLAALIVLILLASSAYFYGLNVRNELVETDARLDRRWEQLEKDLQRRLELVEEFEKIARSSETLDAALKSALESTRGKLLDSSNPSEVANSLAEFDAAMEECETRAQTDATLAADPDFQRLVKELDEAKNRVKTARNRYNEDVDAFNATIARFPGAYYAEKLELSERERCGAAPTKSPQPSAAPSADENAEESVASEASDESTTSPSASEEAESTL